MDQHVPITDETTRKVRLKQFDALSTCHHQLKSALGFLIQAERIARKHATSRIADRIAAMRDCTITAVQEMRHLCGEEHSTCPGSGRLQHDGADGRTQGATAAPTATPTSIGAATDTTTPTATTT